MLRLIGLMISIGFADSLNPSTVAPAMYLATGKRDPRRQVAQFTLGVFAVYLLGGLAVALGPGELVLDLVPHPRPYLKYLFEIIGGVVNASHWLLDTSLFHQMAAAPAISPNWTSGAILTTLGLAAAAVGAVAFRYRDLSGELPHAETPRNRQSPTGGRASSRSSGSWHSMSASRERPSGYWLGWLSAIRRNSPLPTSRARCNYPPERSAPPPGR